MTGQVEFDSHMSDVVAAAVGVVNLLAPGWERGKPYPGAEGSGAVARLLAPREAHPRPVPMRLFHLSIAYLTLLFVAVAVTALLPWGRW